MGYITLDYYKTDYLGIDPDDDTELARYIARASDFVDLLTGNRITDLTTYPALIQKCIKKATASFTEYFVVNGDVFSEDQASSEKIGQWSVSSGKAKKELLSSTGMSWLATSGLMSNIIDVAGDRVYDTDC